MMRMIYWIFLSFGYSLWSEMYMYVFKWSRGNKNGVFNPKRAFQVCNNISCLKCGKYFNVYGSFIAHARWCGREVCTVGHVFLIENYYHCNYLFVCNRTVCEVKNYNHTCKTVREHRVGLITVHNTYG